MYLNYYFNQIKLIREFRAHYELNSNFYESSALNNSSYSKSSTAENSINDQSNVLEENNIPIEIISSGIFKEMINKKTKIKRKRNTKPKELKKLKNNKKGIIQYYKL